jgi:thiamine kinase-like enzyme
MVPEGESPLLLPANQHKQLVVIDFEYSNANLPGLEFANHFVSIFFQTILLFRNYLSRHSMCVRADNEAD